MKKARNDIHRCLRRKTKKWTMRRNERGKRNEGRRRNEGKRRNEGRRSEDANYDDHHLTRDL